MFCINCGNQMEGNAAFCDKCGKQAKPVSDGVVQDRRSGVSAQASAPDSLSFFALLAICGASVILFFMNWFTVLEDFNFSVHNIFGMYRELDDFLRRIGGGTPSELTMMVLSILPLFAIPILNAITCYKIAVSGSYDSAGRARAYGFSRLTGLISAILVVVVLFGMLYVNIAASERVRIDITIISPRFPLFAVLVLSVLNILISGRMKASTQGLKRSGRKLLKTGGIVLLVSGILTIPVYFVGLFSLLNEFGGGFRISEFFSLLGISGIFFWDNILFMYIPSALYIVTGIRCVKHQRSLEKAKGIKSLSTISLVVAIILFLRPILISPGIIGTMSFFLLPVSIFGAICCLVGASRNKGAYALAQAEAFATESEENSSTTNSNT